MYEVFFKRCGVSKVKNQQKSSILVIRVLNRGGMILFFLACLSALLIGSGIGVAAGSRFVGFMVGSGILILCEFITLVLDGEEIIEK